MNLKTLFYRLSIQQHVHLSLINKNEDIKICQEELPFNWNGNIIHARGADASSFSTPSSITGCDSITFLNLNVIPLIPPVTIDTFVYETDMPIEWNGIVLSSDGYGAAVVNTPSEITGCDSITTINLFITPTIYAVDDITICSNELPYLWNGSFIPGAGFGEENFTSVSVLGCDSITALNLIVYDIDSVFIDVEISENDLPFSWNGILVNDFGTSVAIHSSFNSLGCDSITLLNLNSIPTNFVDCDVLIPNAFSPNGDGLNDRFGIVTDGHPQGLQFEIYNRWGERIFVSFKAEDKWDGTINGKPADIGTYFYRVYGVCFDGSILNQKGDFTLIR